MDVIELAGDNAARDLGVVHRGAAAEAAAHLHLGQVNHLNAGAPQQPRPELSDAENVRALTEAVIRDLLPTVRLKLRRIGHAIDEREQVQRAPREPLRPLVPVRFVAQQPGELVQHGNRARCRAGNDVVRRRRFERGDGLLGQTTSAAQLT